MSRFRGPVFKKSRRLEFSILDNNNEFRKWKGRTTKPGQHGNSFRRSKLSFYGKQFIEKQKVKFSYNITNRYLKTLFRKIRKHEGDLGLNLLIALESRLDNFVFRANFAPTRQAARQLVNHNHILLNGKKHNCSSTILKIGDKILLKKKMQENKITVDYQKKMQGIKNQSIAFDKKKFSATYVSYPIREHLNTNIKESLVIELLKC